MVTGWGFIPAPPRFRLAATVLSHGWVFLPPFGWDGETLTFRVRLGKRTQEVSVRQQGKVVAFSPPIPEVAPYVRWVLRLDEDLAPLATHAKHDALVQTALRRGAGRLLRAPTLWEESVRILCTTNIQWSGTIAMMRGLVALGRGNFPTPREILRTGEERLKSEARMGYRAGFLIKFAAQIEGGFALEAWKTALPPVDELSKQIRSWPGYGPYATAHMLVQLGHYRHLPIDSEVRAFHAELTGKNVADKSIVKSYASYGDYAFLAYKLRRIALRKNWIGI